jgi:hypothetical protein
MMKFQLVSYMMKFQIRDISGRLILSSGTCPLSAMRLFDLQAEPYYSFRHYWPRPLKKDPGVIQ